MTITSQMGASTWRMGGSYVYGTAKAAGNRLMIALAQMKGQAIVNLIHPGWVRTDMGGPNAGSTAEESAAGIRKEIASVTADAGKFYKWDGDLHP